MPKSTFARAILLAVFVSLLGAVAVGCVEDEGEPAPPVVERRVGESCGGSEEVCKEGLECLRPDDRCVVLCEVGSDDCGEGIACLPAGEVGFCPLPPETS